MGLGWRVHTHTRHYHLSVRRFSQAASLALRHAHERDANISFREEGHEYKIHGESAGLVSTTALIRSFFSKFDGEAVASRMVKRRDFKTNSNYTKYNTPEFADLTPSEHVAAIIATWSEAGLQASAAGTRLHKGIERFYDEEDIDAALAESTEFKHFLKYDQALKEAGWAPFRTEWLIYDEDHGVTGAIDAVFVQPATGKFMIRDWKRTKAIKTASFGKVGLPPLAHLPDCSHSHYALQQSLYAYILERHYGLALEPSALVVLHDSNESFVEVEVPDMRKEIAAILAVRAGSRGD